LTNTTDDDHTDPVIGAIQERGTDVFRLDVDRLSSGEAEIEINASCNGFQAELMQGGYRCNTDDITSVWYRRPNQFSFPIQDVGQIEFAKKELQSILEGLWLCLQHCRWLNTPWAMQQAKLKVNQLRIAIQLGMTIPDTLITNRPERVVEFVELHGDVIYKAASQPQIEKQGQLLNLPTSLLDDSHLANIGLIRVTPGIFQPFLEKAYEVRVTVVGEDIFAAKLWNAEHPQDVVDWRPPEEFRELTHEAIVLPNEIAYFCHDLLDHFGLQYATCDFVVNGNDEYTFLEINPNGQWLWIERFLDLPISAAIANLLV
jgi:hypothetical protein